MANQYVKKAPIMPNQNAKNIDELSGRTNLREGQRGERRQNASSLLVLASQSFSSWLLLFTTDDGNQWTTFIGDRRQICEKPKEWSTNSWRGSASASWSSEFYMFPKVTFMHYSIEIFQHQQYFAFSLNTTPLCYNEHPASFSHKYCICYFLQAH